jgi:branched-chain amino acid aminotransferase
MLVNLDGAIVPPEQARVSVLDRGFLYGDSVYEVVRTYGGRPFELALHLERLAHSAERVGLEPRWDAGWTGTELARTLAAARALPAPAPDPDAAPWNVGEWSARIIMTRGAGELGLDPALAAGPVAVIIVREAAAPPLRAYAEGVAVALAGTRRPPPEAVDPSAKTGAHLMHVLALKEARASGAHEALLLDGRGLVTEGSSSNVFVVRGGRLCTPPPAAGILEGVTRRAVLLLARAEGVPVEEVPLRPEEVEGAEEVFITSTLREILPVVRVGPHAVGSGRPGPMTARLHQAFRRMASQVGPTTPR